MARKQKPDDPKQSERFKKAAREVEVDENIETFNQTFEKVTTPLSNPNKERT